MMFDLSPFGAMLALSGGAFFGWMVWRFSVHPSSPGSSAYVIFLVSLLTAGLQQISRALSGFDVLGSPFVPNFLMVTGLSMLGAYASHRLLVWRELRL